MIMYSLQIIKYFNASTVIIFK